MQATPIRGSVVSLMDSHNKGSGASLPLRSSEGDEVSAIISSK